jgi:hypothetical protein
MKRTALVVCACLTFSSLHAARAQDEIRPAPTDPLPGNSPGSMKISVPYAFYNDSFGAAVGYVYSFVGYPQKQAALLGTAMFGSKGSAMAFLMAKDVQMPWGERFFTDAIFSVGYFVDNDAYIDGNPNFTGQRAGAHNSDENNFVTGDGLDNFLRVKFRYLLPIGNGRDEVIPEYKFENGELVSGASGGSSLNPFESGRTFLEVRPFYRSLSIDGDDVDTDLKTNGFDFSLFWDNRDIPFNPSVGNSARVRVGRDFGELGSSGSWTVYEAEMDKYFPLGESDWFRQRVLSFDVWGAYSPTWEEQADGSINNGPPPYTGAALGGLFRMRGYPSQRFSDKAALMYSTELRLTPRWNPFVDWTTLQKHLGVQWVQFAAFAEVGRVAPEWDFGTLNRDMNVDGGVGVRLFAKGLVLRIDIAASDEGSRVQMMVGNAFQQ